MLAKPNSISEPLADKKLYRNFNNDLFYQYRYF